MADETQQRSCNSLSPASNGLSDIPDFSSLQSSPASLLSKLKNFIERKDEYFILTGSDPSELDGCCPSDEVAAANKLIQAGILQSWRQPLPSDACTTTIYAFNSEIRLHPSSDPTFVINEQLRNETEGYIQKIDTDKDQPVRKLIRWVLLLFILSSLVYIFYSDYRRKNRGRYIAMSSVLDYIARPLPDKFVVVAFFHSADKCRFCENMEHHTHQALDTYFKDKMKKRQIMFAKIDKDNPVNRDLIRKYDVVTSSVLLFELNKGQVGKSETLTEAWHLADSEAEFIEMLKKKLNSFMGDSQ